MVCFIVPTAMTVLVDGGVLQELASQLDETLTLAGEVVVQLATNAGTAIKSAQTALDKVLPGPDVQKVLIDLRCVCG